MCWEDVWCDHVLSYFPPLPPPPITFQCFDHIIGVPLYHSPVVISLLEEAEHEEGEGGTPFRVGIDMVEWGAICLPIGNNFYR